MVIMVIMVISSGSVKEKERPRECVQNGGPHDTERAFLKHTVPIAPGGSAAAVMLQGEGLSCFSAIS